MGRILRYFMRGSMNVRLFLVWIFLAVLMIAVGRAAWSVSSAVVAVADYVAENPACVQVK